MPIDISIGLSVFMLPASHAVVGEDGETAVTMPHKLAVTKLNGHDDPEDNIRSRDESEFSALLKSRWF